MTLRRTLVPSPAHPRWEGPSVSVPTDSFLLAKALLLVMVATTVDVFNLLDRGGSPRYLLLVPPLLAVFLARSKHSSSVIRRSTPADRILLLLVLFGTSGTLYGLVFQGTSSTARPVFFAMVVAFTYLLTLQEPTEREVERITWAIGAIGFLYLSMNVVVNWGIIPSLLEFRQYRNASFPYVALGFGVAIVWKHWGKVALMSLLATLVFITYPAATTLLVITAMILTLFVTRPTASNVRPYVVALTVAAAGTITLLNFSTGVEVSNRYFDLVDKANANEGRLDLWSSGIDRFRESPLVGSAFSRDIVVERSRDGKPLPYHNDFILFMAEGGLVGLGLFVGWMAAVELSIIRRYRGFLRKEMISRARLLRAILVGLNGFFVAALFNPVFPGLSRAATVFGLYAISMSLGDPQRREVPDGTPQRTVPVSSS